MKSIIKDCLPLAQKFPGTREYHLGRLCHAAHKGYLLCLIDNGNVIGYAELYKVKDVPKYPSRILPDSEEGGRVLFCYALAIEADKPKALKEMMRMGKSLFSECESLAFHARNKNYRLYQERWN